MIHTAMPLPPGLAAAKAARRSVSMPRSMPREQRPRSLSRDYEPPAPAWDRDLSRSQYGGGLSAPRPHLGAGPSSLGHSGPGGAPLSAAGDRDRAAYRGVIPLEDVPARAMAFAASCEALASLSGGLASTVQNPGGDVRNRANHATALAVLRDVLMTHAHSVEVVLAAVGAAASALDGSGDGASAADAVSVAEAPEARGRLDVWLTSLAAVCSRHGAAADDD